MQNKTFKNFVQKILNEGKISASQVGDSIKRTNDFTTLLNGGFIEHLPAITGGGSFHIKNKTALEKYFQKSFPKNRNTIFLRWIMFTVLETQRQENEKAKT